MSWKDNEPIDNVNSPNCVKLKLASEINKSDVKAFIAVTGGGSGFIGDFLGFGGGSATILGFYVPYDQRVLSDFIGKSPEKYVSSMTARQLAMASYSKSFNNVGIGLTCSLTNPPDKERVGRLNHGYFAIQTHDYTMSGYFNLDKTKYPTRFSQESYTTDLIYSLLVYCADKDVEKFKASANVDSVIVNNATDDVYHIFNGTYNHAFIDTKPDSSSVAIIPGSFNPFHEGHERFSVLANINNRTPVYEISVTNFEKPKIDYHEIQKRIDDIKSKNHHVILSNNHMMLNKVLEYRYHDDVHFYIGYDTWVRISDDDKRSIMVINTQRENPIQFCVFPRNGNRVSESDKFSNLLTDECKTDEFNNNWELNISSTELRNI